MKIALTIIRLFDYNIPTKGTYRNKGSHKKYLLFIIQQLFKNAYIYQPTSLPFFKVNNVHPAFQVF